MADCTFPEDIAQKADDTLDDVLVFTLEDGTIGRARAAIAKALIAERERHFELSGILMDKAEKGNADSIRTAIADLKVLEQHKAAALSSVRRAKSALKAELVAIGEEQREVTDHAVLRYLERFMNVDTDVIREKIRSLAADAVATKDGEHYWHNSGVVLVLGDRGQIITVLSPDQSAAHEGRRLKNGERAERA